MGECCEKARSIQPEGMHEAINTGHAKQSIQGMHNKEL